MKSIFVYELLGFSGGEVFGHAWTHWWRLEQFPSQLNGTSLTVGTDFFPAIDPVPTIISSFISLLGGISFGYNAWVCIALLLAVIGGYKLAESEKGDPWIGGLILAWSPIFLGTIASGLTEDMGLGITAIALSLLGKRPVLSGVILGLVGWCGLVLGWMSGLLAIVLGIRLLCKKNRTVFLSAFITAICISPLLWIHHQRLTMTGHRFGEHKENFEPLWMINPWKQIDLASLFTIEKQDYVNEIIRLHPGYIGFSLIIVAFFSRSKFWWGVFLFFVFLSLGGAFHWKGSNTGVSNFLHNLCGILPGQDLLNHQGRFLLMALIALSVLVAKGMQRIPYRTFWRFVIAFELIFCSPIGFFVPGTNYLDSTVLKSIKSEEGRILRIPTMGPEISYQQALWEQTKHGLPLLLNPNRPGISAMVDPKSNLFWIDRIAFVQTIEPEKFCFPNEISGLLVQSNWSDSIEKTFGNATQSDELYSFWDSDKLQAYRCSF
jgi:hypothetical protein